MFFVIMPRVQRMERSYVGLHTAYTRPTHGLHTDTIGVTAVRLLGTLQRLYIRRIMLSLSSGTINI